MSRLEQLHKNVTECLGELCQESKLAYGELTIEVASKDIKTVLLELRDDKSLRFEQLIDLCGVDYSRYTDFLDRSWDKPRFAVVYHMQSIAYNWRMRIRAFLPEESPVLDSVTDIWQGANWFEREAFDVMGIIFTGHPDLRRILTDYGFIGHPFRKDFPLSGHVEMRYDEEKGRVVYEPVTVEPRILTPRMRHETAEQREGQESE